MGNTPEQSNLSAMRQAQYGESWVWLGMVIQILKPFLTLLINSGFFHPWYQIMTKLIRLLVSPNHLDSWRDIIGYAELVVTEMEAELNDAG